MPLATRIKVVKAQPICKGPGQGRLGARDGSLASRFHAEGCACCFSRWFWTAVRRLSADIQGIECVQMTPKYTKPTSEVLGGFLSQCDVYACQACFFFASFQTCCAPEAHHPKKTQSTGEAWGLSIPRVRVDLAGGQIRHGRPSTSCGSMCVQVHKCSFTRRSGCSQHECVPAPGPAVRKRRGSMC